MTRNARECPKMPEYTVVYHLTYALFYLGEKMKNFSSNKI